MINRRIAFVVLCAVFMAMLLIFLILRLSHRKELNFVCEHHEDFYRTKIIGSVICHYVDSKDHARRTIVIRDQNGKEYVVWFIPYDNWVDFDHIRIKNVVKKEANSFTFTADNERIVHLQYNCNYD